MGTAATSDDDGARELRDTVRFYLLDHRTWLGKAIDIALMVLNLVFVAVFVAETYPLSATTDALLWDLEVAIGVTRRYV